MADAQQARGLSPLAEMTSYDLRHVPLHLAAAGLHSDLHRLLSLEQETSRTDTALRPAVGSKNAWYAAVMVHGDLQLYLDHLDIGASTAREQTRQELKRGRAATALGYATRYALSMAAVRNVAANMSVRLLISMVRRGDLVVAEALAYIRQIPDPRDRAEGLTAALEVLSHAKGDVDVPSDVAAEALGAVSAIPDEFWRVGELGRLAEHLPEDMARRAAAIARTVTDAYLRAVAFSMVGEPIDPALEKSVQALPYHRKIAATELESSDGAQAFRAEFNQRRSHAVANLTPFVREGGARHITSAYWLAESLAALADDSEQYRDAAIAAAGRVGGKAAHAALLRAAAVWLTESGQFSAAMELAAVEVHDPSQRLILECELAAAGGMPVTVARVEALPDPDAQLGALRTLLPRLSGSQRHRAVAVLLALTGDRSPADGLTQAAPYLDTQGWRTAVEAARALADREERMRVLGVLAGRAIALGLDELPDVLSSLLASIEDRFWYGQAVEGLVSPLMDAGFDGEALRLAKTSPYPHRRAVLIAQCANGLQGIARDAAAASARRLTDEPATSSGQVRAKTLVADALPDDPDCPLLDQAASIAIGMEKGLEPVRSGALASVAASFAFRLRLERALTIAAEIVDEYWCATALERVAAHGDAYVLEIVLARGRSLRSRGERFRVLSAVARRHAALGGDEFRLNDVWEEVLANLASGSREDCVHGLTTLLPVVAALGGPEALTWVAAESRRTMRWWE